MRLSWRLVAEHEYAGPDCVLDRSCPSQGNNPTVLYHTSTSIDRCVEDNDGSIYSSLGPGQLATVARGRAPVPDSSGKYDKKEESVDSIGAAEAAIGPLFLGALGVRGTRARGRTRRPPAARAPNSRAIAFGTNGTDDPTKRSLASIPSPHFPHEKEKSTAPRTRCCGGEGPAIRRRPAARGHHGRT